MKNVTRFQALYLASSLPCMRLETSSRLFLSHILDLEGIFPSGLEWVSLFVIICPNFFNKRYSYNEYLRINMFIYFYITIDYVKVFRKWFVPFHSLTQNCKLQWNLFYVAKNYIIRLWWRRLYSVSSKLSFIIWSSHDYQILKWLQTVLCQKSESFRINKM